CSTTVMCGYFASKRSIASVMIAARSSLPHQEMASSTGSASLPGSSVESVVVSPAGVVVSGASGVPEQAASTMSAATPVASVALREMDRPVRLIAPHFIVSIYRDQGTAGHRTMGVGPAV